MYAYNKLIHRRFFGAYWWSGWPSWAVNRYPGQLFIHIGCLQLRFG